MKSFFIRWFMNIIALAAVINIAPGISSDRLEATILAALILGLINAFLRPFVIILTLPLTIISLGFFTLFINGFMFYLVSKIVAGFAIKDFWSAFWGALCFSVVSFLLNMFISPQGGIKAYRYENRRTFKRSSDSTVIDVDAKVEDKDSEAR